MRGLSAITLALAATAASACNSSRRLTCDHRIEGLSASPGDILWFGEPRGTEQAPAFVGDVVCQLARMDSVQLGLEVPQDEQLRIHRYLMDGDRAALLAGPFWSRAEGHGSRATVSLLDRVRSMRTRGGRIEVVALDAGGEDRDLAMARVVSGSRNPSGVFVVLSERVHARKTASGGALPAVARLLAERLPVRSYDAAGPDGPAWTLVGATDPAHDGVYHLGVPTSSPPVSR